MTRSRLASLLPLLLLVGAAGAVAQDAPAPSGASAEQVSPPLTFAAEVEQVIVDLVVTDKKGNPIPGISEDDLVVLEDDVPQSTASFEAVALPDEPGAAAPPPLSVSTNAAAELERGRTFVVIFDDMNLSPQRAHGAKAAVVSFLETAVREGDYVSLVATSGAAWWTTRMEAGRDGLVDMLKRLDGRRIPDRSPERLTDWEAMRIHSFRDSQVTKTVMRRFEKYGVSMLAQRDPNNPLTGTVSDPFVIARAAEVYLEGGVRAVEIGTVMFGHSDPQSGEEVPSKLELVRLAIPRRVYTKSHIDYLIDVTLAVWARRESIGGFRFVEQAPVLRHFTARFEPLYPMDA